MPDFIPEGPNGQLAIFCFGSLRIYFNRSLLVLSNRKSEELLALLACQKGTAISKVKLSQTLWPDADPKRALDSLYKAMRPLQKLNKEHSFPLISSSGRLALDIGRFYCDLAEFDQLYLEHTQQSFQRAVSLYKGPVLLNPPYDWTIDQDAYYDIRLLEMLEYLSEYYSTKDPILSLTYRNMQEELFQ